jgi:hypothetical protein
MLTIGLERKNLAIVIRAWIIDTTIDKGVASDVDARRHPAVCFKKQAFVSFHRFSPSVIHASTREGRC